MSLAAHRRTATRTIVLDRSLEALPLFRLSDSADDSAVIFAPESGGRWRVLPNPGDRVPGTFDQDVYVELLHRYHEANCPDDGVVTFTLHAFLRSIGRRVDGRTYEQLRSALTRLERTGEPELRLMAWLRGKLVEHRKYICQFREDMPEIRNFRWPADGAPRSV